MSAAIKARPAPLATVTRLRGARGMVAGYSASLGPFEARGETPGEARAALAAAVAWFGENLYKRRYVHCVDGTVLALFATPHGWEYEITDPSRGHPCSVMLGHRAHSDALEAVVKHAAAYGGAVEWPSCEKCGRRLDREKCCRGGCS